MPIQVWFSRILSLLLIMLILSGSVVSPSDAMERVRDFTRQIEFDFVNWTLNAMRIKLGQGGVAGADYLTAAQSRQITLDYLELVGQIQDKERLLRQIYADPAISDPVSSSRMVRAELDELYRQRRSLGPLAESVLQGQLAEIIAEMDLSLAGQPTPPVLYHVTPLPMALIVSPRQVIRQDHNISLLPELTLEEQVAVEERVAKGLDVSTLVVGIGGIGVYPTMVMQTNDLNWLAEVVAHEWIHNYLTLRPLGINYLASPELRTMNETTASIAGQELGRALVQKFYPELAPPPLPPPAPQSESLPEPPPAPPQPPVFDFRAEMRQTRVTTDELLAQGKIQEAEAYMEQRRAFMWENGYQIRKLNQAYFAFYGAYADQPGGAAGADPVGAAVRALRARSPSLAAFINRISWMWSYEMLQAQ